MLVTFTVFVIGDVLHAKDPVAQDRLADEPHITEL
jgi:hypothetical protein